MHRFFSSPANFSEHIVVLDMAETRHLRDVLRVKIGEVVSVFDGFGNEFVCKVTTVSKAHSELEIIEKTDPAAPESCLRLTLAAVMLKGEKYDLVVQKAVELGVTKIVPLWSVRCDVRSKDSAKRVERWRKIALEASKQAGRATLIEIDDPIPLNAFIERAENLTVMFSERAGTRLDVDHGTRDMTAIVGPEGGWDDAELAAARLAGICVVTLGGRIVRAETAAIAIAAILQNRFGDLN